jgi:hypothetical protein
MMLERGNVLWRVYLGEGVHGFLEEANLKLAQAYTAAKLAARAAGVRWEKLQLEGDVPVFRAELR